MIPPLETTYSDTPEPWNCAGQAPVTLASRIRSWAFAATFYVAFLTVIASPAAYTVHMIT